jgi:hypothetical protein
MQMEECRTGFLGMLSVVGSTRRLIAKDRVRSFVRGYAPAGVKGEKARQFFREYFALVLFQPLPFYENESKGVA